MAKNKDIPRIPEKRKLSKIDMWIFCEQVSMVNKAESYQEILLSLI